MEPLIQADQISKIYNARRPDEVRAVEQVSLTVQPGEFTVFKGPSGSGKTSLLSLIGCMARPTSGSILVQGRDVARLPERFLTQIRRGTFGFIFQQFNLVRDISVLENVLLPLYPLDLGLAAMQRRADAVLERLSLRHKARARVRQLSGGEQQRVAIARALINDPLVVIADEPTAHLDSLLAAELMEHLQALHAAGKTVLIASHDPFVCDHPRVKRTVAMRDGRIDGAAPR
jgi:putative ABC transport system ATP-binding protein